MQHAAQTYGAVANKTANPRELEADLLLIATVGTASPPSSTPRCFITASCGRSS
jgi:hypothetical protein